MACVELTAARATDRPVVRLSRAGLAASLSPVRATRRMSVRFGVVCTPMRAAYLNLEPEYLWLSGSNNFSGDVLVWSNVTWSVG